VIVMEQGRVVVCGATKEVLKVNYSPP
jgi:hypothetical protein